MSAQSRESLLRRGLVALGAIVGVGAGAGATALATAPSAAAPQRLRLDGRAWTLSTPGRRTGERIEPGDRSTVHGELLDRDGIAVGSFLGSRVAAATTAGAFESDASLELHTFTLRGGTLLGMGSAFPGAGVFAIVGGSGRYAGARGTYTAAQSPLELGGDGTAIFDIDLTS